jgi:polyferredoxin
MPYDKSDKRSQRAFRALRLAVRAALLALSTALGLMHQFQRGTRPVGVDALCPFGAIEAAYTLLASGSLMERVSWSSFALLLATVLAALLFRRVFCGKICAFGTLQELFARLGKGLFRRRFVVPESADKPARCLKYAVLAGTVAASAIAGQLFIRPYDPWATYQHLFSRSCSQGFGSACSCSPSALSVRSSSIGSFANTSAPWARSWL